MGLLKKIKKIKVGKALGKVAGVAAPILAATGVGLPIAAAIGAGGGLLRGEGVKGAALGAGSAALGGIGAKAGGVTKAAIGSRLKSAGLSAGKTLLTGGSASDALKSGITGGLTAATPGDALASGGGGIVDRLKSVGGGIVRGAIDNPELVLGAASLYQGQQAQKKADKMADKQMAYAEQQMAERAPLRAAGMSGMLDESRPDLSRIYGGTSNPFSAPPAPLMSPEGPAPLRRVGNGSTGASRPRGRRLQMVGA